MKLSPIKSSAKKTMRVATVITGAAACATAFAPTLPAEATPDLPAVVNGGIPISPYYLWVRVSPRVSTIQACGYEDVSGGKWACTGIERVTASVRNSLYTEMYMPIYANWRRGLIKLWWNKHGAGSWDECNTNGDYNGEFIPASNHQEVVLTNSHLGQIGFGVPTC